MALEEMGLAPRENAHLFGHEKTENMLFEACQAGRLHHSLLLAGTKGVGKATLAYRLARHLLADEGSLPMGGRPFDMSADHPVFKQIAAGAHPALAVIDRTTGAEDGKKTQRDIPVKAIRKLSDFFRLTSIDRNWRIGLIDSADDMSPNAANALLKILEEPPERSLIILISHAPGGLLPTIKSRCGLQTLNPLSNGELTSVLRAVADDISADDLPILSELSNGSAGAAISLHAAGGLEIHRRIEKVLSAGKAPEAAAVDEICELAARRNQDAAFAAFGRLLEDAISKRILASVGEGSEAGAPGALEPWLQLWDKTRSLLGRADRSALDRKHVILNIFSDIAAVVGRV